MQYETFPVMGAANPPLHSGEVNDVADEISAYYSRVAEEGGRVVASHNLVCDIDISRTSNKKKAPKSSRVEMLFLVAEMPDSYFNNEDK